MGRLATGVLVAGWLGLLFSPLTALVYSCEMRLEKCTPDRLDGCEGLWRSGGKCERRAKGENVSLRLAHSVLSFLGRARFGVLANVMCGVSAR